MGLGRSNTHYEVDGGTGVLLRKIKQDLWISN